MRRQVSRLRRTNACDRRGAAKCARLSVTFVWRRWCVLALQIFIGSVIVEGCGRAEKDGSTTSSCPPGTPSCPCRDDATCLPHDKTPHICDRGFCVPDDCPAGTKDCRCYGNATCDVLDAVPMTCDGNVCKPTVLPASGELNGTCTSTTDCKTKESSALGCASGLCQRVDCPSGRLGCPCKVYGKCDDSAGNSVICNGGVCLPPDCKAGKAGCLCSKDSTCDAGSTCTLGVCRSAGATLKLQATGARACDVVLELAELAGAKAEFDAAVLGETYQRGKRFALSFMARADTDLSGDIAVIERQPTWWGDSATAFSAVPILDKSTCYDRLGAVLADSSVTLR